MVRTLLRHSHRRQLSQLVIHQRQQLIGGDWITSPCCSCYGNIEENSLFDNFDSARTVGVRVRLARSFRVGRNIEKSFNKRLPTNRKFKTDKNATKEARYEIDDGKDVRRLGLIGTKTGR